MKVNSRIFLILILSISLEGCGRRGSLEYPSPTLEKFNEGTTLEQTISEVKNREGVQNQKSDIYQPEDETKKNKSNSKAYISSQRIWLDNLL